MRRVLSQLFAASAVLVGAAHAHAQRLPHPLPIPICMPDLSKSQPYTADGSTDIGPLHVKGGVGLTLAFNAGCGQMQASATGDLHAGIGGFSTKPLEIVLSATTGTENGAVKNSLDVKLVAFGYTMWMDNLASSGAISDAKSYGYVLPGGNMAGHFSYQAPFDWLPAAASLDYNTAANVAVAPIYTINNKEVTLRLISSAVVSASVHAVADVKIKDVGTFSATGDGVIEIVRLTQGGHATVKDRRRFPGDPIINPYSADAANSLALTHVAGGYLTLSVDYGLGTWSKDLFNIPSSSYYMPDFTYSYPPPIVVKG